MKSVIKKDGVKRMGLRKEWLWGYMFVAPMFLGVMVFGLFPVVYALGLSMTEWNLLSGFESFVGVKNFITVFTEKTTLNEIRNTFVYAMFQVPITVLLSLFFANLLSKGIRAKGFFRIVYFLPNIVMSTAVAMIWKWLLNSKYGLVNIFLGTLGLPTPGWIIDPNYIMAALIMVGVWNGMGYNTLIMLAAVQGISREIYESAELDGAGSFTKFWKITIPMVSPSLFFLLTTGVMKAMRSFDMVYAFIGKDQWNTGGPLLDAVRTMVYGIYVRAFTYLDMGMASAEAVVLFGSIMIITVIQFKLQKKWVNYD